MIDFLLNNLQDSWLWLKALVSNNWALIFAYAGMIIAIFYKELHTRMYIKLTRQHLKHTQDQEKALEKAIQTAKDLNNERIEYLKQIKHERQQKNFYKQKLDEYIKRKEKAA